ncbi:tyrosine-type recombinase/integrase [Granulicella sp. WH15]|uniref:tyrosine-type recombinase/integrase n=1 Tax=Granulicella sp. WH15 TaxID=2602070 RepID=UPI0013676362|nr:tyrosine-type recombinase/integrase [Granulicella sp. WH15]QHN03415.1 tyrosine-type recombinase/integrase [Granulicella sp. WH15]
MRLAEGIELFVARKRDARVAYRQPEAMLRRFNQLVGDIHLSEVTTQDVASYLDLNSKEPYIWQVKYLLVRRLFEYWTALGVMEPFLMPHRRLRVRSTFLPYVYNHAEIRCLLQGTAKVGKDRLTALEPKTYRMILLLLYATGITPAEAVLLARLDINFKKKTLAVFEPRSRRRRTIPISEELCGILREYFKWRFGSNKANERLFIKKSGCSIPTASMQHYFARLVRHVNARRRDGVPGWPRMSDFRCSFAVHRITEWLKDGSNMNQTLPAMSAYLGQIGPHSIERYIRLTPERFRKSLLSLSPMRGRKRWRDDENLMRFLASL